MRTLGLTRLVGALSAASFWPAPARACPFCNSSTAQQVRAGIFNSDFTYNLSVTVAPFVVLFAVLILILYWPTVPLKLTAKRASSPKAPN